ncbi:MAG: outer membrane beta-barrel protein [Gammaproteobacteria bacterium]|nr:outer membrane beta-barrel protein [Gammaproteobacteria bacterium]
MKNDDRRRCWRVGGLVLFLSIAVPAHAAVLLASPNEDNLAKTAVPLADKALVYVYRADDADSSTATLLLNGSEAAYLGARTFGYWSMAPGRVEARLAGTAISTALTVEAGRIYYIELYQSTNGLLALKPVSFAIGRSQIQRGQLVAAPGGPSLTPTRIPAASAASTATPSAATVIEPGIRSRRTRAAVSPKFGNFTLAEESQTFLGVDRQFDDSGMATGVEVEWFLRPTLSLGVELMRYSNDYTSPSTGASGSIDSQVILFNGKYYFHPQSAWQPYIGAGVGGVAVDFSGGISGDAGGPALQLVGGVQWRFISWFALRTEVKYLHAIAEDEGGHEINVSGSGIFLSATGYF